MEFEQLKLTHIGATAEDGVSLIDELEWRLEQLSALIISDLYERKATINVAITLERQGDGSVLIDAGVKWQAPQRKRRGVLAWVGKDGRLRTQNPDQLALPWSKPDIPARTVLASAEEDLK